VVLILFPPQISLAIKVFGNEVKYLRLNGVDEINKAIRSFDVYNIMKSFMNGRVNISRVILTFGINQVKVYFIIFYRNLNTTNPLCSWT